MLQKIEYMQFFSYDSILLYGRHAMPHNFSQLPPVIYQKDAPFHKKHVTYNIKQSGINLKDENRMKQSFNFLRFRQRQPIGQELGDIMPIPEQFANNGGANMR